MFDLCYFSKSVDIVKVVVNATEANVHGTRIHRLADQWRDRHPGTLFILNYIYIFIFINFLFRSANYRIVYWRERKDSKST